MVRVEAGGAWRGDWHFGNGDWTWMGLNLPLPRVLGREVGGMVGEIGPGARAVTLGDRATIPFHEADGTRPYCRAERVRLAPSGAAV